MCSVQIVSVSSRELAVYFYGQVVQVRSHWLLGDSQVYQEAYRQLLPHSRGGTIKTIKIVTC